MTQASEAAKELKRLTRESTCYPIFRAFVNVVSSVATIAAIAGITMQLLAWYHSGVNFPPILTIWSAGIVTGILVLAQILTMWIDLVDVIIHARAQQVIPPAPLEELQP